MKQFVVRLRPIMESAGVAAGTEVARFDTQEEAEYFMSLAVKLRALRQCDLAVARVDAGQEWNFALLPPGNLQSQPTTLVEITVL